MKKGTLMDSVKLALRHRALAADKTAVQIAWRLEGLGLAPWLAFQEDADFEDWMPLAVWLDDTLKLLAPAQRRHVRKRLRALSDEQLERFFRPEKKAAVAAG
jgi:hypothetical protein